MSAVMNWMTTQISSSHGRMGRRSDNKPVRVNPRPKGVVVGGSTTEVVREFMQAHDSVWLTKSQIRFMTKRTSKSVDWALIFLRRQGLLQCVEDASRNPRYLRYRWGGEALKAPIGRK